MDNLEVRNIVYESCVMCEKETNVDKNSHISTRTTYIEGAGQLCIECYDGVYS